MAPTRQRGIYKGELAKRTVRPPAYLSLDAPIGTYHVDRIAGELSDKAFALAVENEFVFVKKSLNDKSDDLLKKLLKELLIAEAKSLNSNVDVDEFLKAKAEYDRIEFIQQLRGATNYAARRAIDSHQGYYEERPRQLKKIERFGKDIALIDKLVGRNKDLEKLELILAEKWTVQDQDEAPLVICGDEVPIEGWDQREKTMNEIFAALEVAVEKIKIFQSVFRLKRKGGNYDPLSEAFMVALCRQFPCIDNDKLFVRLLCAAWRDVKFPTKEAEGRRLDDWFAERVRKQTFL